MVTDKSEPETLTGQEAVASEVWWRTISPSEVRESSRLVSEFIDGEGATELVHIEAFARSLALQQLFADGEALLNAAHEAYRRIPLTPSRGAAAESVSKAGPWLARGRALDVGLRRSLKLLRPKEDGAWEAAVNRFQLALDALERDIAVYGGLKSTVAVSKPYRAGPLKA